MRGKSAIEEESGWPIFWNGRKGERPVAKGNKFEILVDLGPEIEEIRSGYLQNEENSRRTEKAI